jgi:hypothetical protein
MRWFYAVVVVAVLVAADRAYMRGANTELALSAMRSVAATINRQVDDLLRYLRR